MRGVQVLVLADNRPGHYHLSQGVVAALKRLGHVEATELRISRRKLIPTRSLRWLNGRGTAPERVLKLGYGLDAAALPAADLVVSAGGETLPANVAAARALGAQNIFCGSLRTVAPEDVSVTVTSYERFAGKPGHLVTLKPSAIDPQELGRPNSIPRYDAANPPKLAGLLIGGDSGLFHYRDEEWRRLLDFARSLSAQWGTRWLVSTSRRTPDPIAEEVFALAKDKQVVADFLDYRWAGPGTLPKIFARAEAIVCSEDSSTMISEAIAARLPVIGVSPENHSFKAEEAEYRGYLMKQNWCRYLPIASLDPERFGAALGQVTPMGENHLDLLAAALKERMPKLFKQ
jgi:hypothetical protein